MKDVRGDDGAGTEVKSDAKVMVFPENDGGGNDSVDGFKIRG